jgi:hypothetical protein
LPIEPGQEDESNPLVMQQPNAITMNMRQTRKRPQAGEASLPRLETNHVAKTRPRNEGVASRKIRRQKEGKDPATSTAPDKHGMTATR